MTVSAPLRWAGIALVVAASAIVVVALQIRQRGDRSLAASEKALGEGDVPAAIAWARDAAMCVAPGSRAPEIAYVRLVEIAGRAEEHGDFPQATMAWRAVWTAIRATRSEEALAVRREEAAQSLVRIAAKTCEGDQTRPPATCAAAAQASLREGALPTLPRFRWLALGGLLVFGGGIGASRSAGRGRALAVSLSLVGVGLAALALFTR